jgi:hypothetical protein
MASFPHSHTRQALPYHEEMQNECGQMQTSAEADRTVCQRSNTASNGRPLLSNYELDLTRGLISNSPKVVVAKGEGVRTTPP